jgi:hypothetical protein
VFLRITQSDFYNNTGDGIRNNASTTNSFFDIRNCNFVKNGGAGINNTQVKSTGYTYNNAYGAGTQANGSSDTYNGIEHSATDITLASNVTPWVDPANGDFRISLGAVMNVGRGAFTQTAPAAGTIGYPDIGAANHFDVGSAAINLSDTVLPDGYVGLAYSLHQTFASAAPVSIASGSLPTGLALTQPTGSEMLLSGTPTTAGAYTFTVRVTVGGAFSDFIDHITINASPDSGTGGVGVG